MQGIVKDIFNTKILNKEGTLTLVEVDILNSGQTTNGKTINFINNMSAQIDVVIERRNLAERIFSRIRTLRKD